MRDTISLVMGLVLIGCATVQTEPDKFVLPAGKHFFGDVLVRADGFLGGKFMYEPTDLEAARSSTSSYVVTREDVRVDAAGCVDLVCRIGYLANFAVFARGHTYEVVFLRGPIRRESLGKKGR